MSTSASGRVVDQAGAGIPNLNVCLDDISRVNEVSLKKAATDPAGNFTLAPYADDVTVSNEPGRQVRQLRLRIKVGEHVVKEIQRADTPAPIVFDPIELSTNEATGWWATLGTGEPSRLSHSNAVRWLVDNEDAWGHAQGVIANAGTLDILQLYVDVNEFSPTVTSEKPKVILQFDPTNPLTAANRRDIDPDDKRIERSIMARVENGKDVRIQVPEMRVDRHGLVTIGAIAGLGGLVILGGAIAGLVAVIAGAILAGLGVIALAGLFVLEALVFKGQGGDKKLARWFDRAVAHLQSTNPTTTPGTVRVSKLVFRSNNLTHSKLVIDRNVEAVVLGSPFGQVYFDSHHALDDPRRGANASKGPIHEMSAAVRGGAVGHLQQVFNTHWNLAEPSDQLFDPPPIPGPPTQFKPGEFQASVQVVRTLDRMLTPGSDGETGVLEAYLRAIHFASRFIYIENQYFNNDRITDALIAAMDKGVKVILLLNPTPDMPLYLGWQQKALRRMADSLRRKNINPADRLGVFSTWTHAPADATSPKPTLVDNYLHTKCALIDNVWATVGSANLDGASLDYIQYARPLTDGNLLNSEANIVVYEDAGTLVSAVDALRRRLWAEHLGFPTPAATELNDTPNTNWLAVWRQRATIKKDGLMTNLNTVSPIRVLEFPSAPFEERVSLPRRHNNHAMAVAFLQHLFSPDEQPSDVLVSQFNVLGEKGPRNHEFRYPLDSTPPISEVPPVLETEATSADPATT